MRIHVWNFNEWSHKSWKQFSAIKCNVRKFGKSTAGLDWDYKFGANSLQVLGKENNTTVFINIRLPSEYHIYEIQKKLQFDDRYENCIYIIMIMKLISRKQPHQLQKYELVVWNYHLKKSY